jgi:hypothetical protein
MKGEKLAREKGEGRVHGKENRVLGRNPLGKDVQLRS